MFFFQSHTEQVLQQLNNQVLTLPSLDAGQLTDGQLSDNQLAVGARVPTRGPTRGPMVENTAMLKRVPPRKMERNDVQVTGPTPGQFVIIIFKITVCLGVEKRWGDPCSVELEPPPRRKP